MKLSYFSSTTRINYNQRPTHQMRDVYSMIFCSGTLAFCIHRLVCEPGLVGHLDDSVLLLQVIREYMAYSAD